MHKSIMEHCKKIFFEKKKKNGQKFLTDTSPKNMQMEIITKEIYIKTVVQNGTDSLEV